MGIDATAGAATGAPVVVRPRPRGAETRIRLYGRAVLIAVAAAFAISVLAATGADTVSGRLGGDFPAFYAAGSIVGDGDWADLYDPDRQAEAQEALFPETDGAYLYFAYPPHVAALYRPLAALDYRLAYAVHSIAMAAALAGAIALMRPMVGLFRRHGEACFTVALVSYPLLRAVTGGQNTAMTLLLLAAVWRAHHDGRDVAAGLCLGLLVYKPQFAVPLAGLFLVTGRFRTVASAAAGAGAAWVVGALTMGVGWVGTWWDEVATFAELDADVNAHNAVSWPGVVEGLFGAGSTAAKLIAAPVVLGVAMALVVLWRSPLVRDELRWAATFAGLVVMSPHAMFYDAGLTVIAGLILLGVDDGRARALLALAWASLWLQPWADGVGLALAVPAVWAVTAAAFVPALRRPEPTGTPHSVGGAWPHDHRSTVGRADAAV